MKIDVGFRRIENKKKYDRIWRKKYNKLTANIKRKLSDMRYIDKKRGHDICDFTYEELLHMLSTNRCCYCDSTDNLGLDRIDNTRGHTKDNVVVACLFCNTIRGDRLTYEEMLETSIILEELLNCNALQQYSFNPREILKLNICIKEIILRRKLDQ